MEPEARIVISAAPQGNGYAALISYPDGVTINSAESYPTIPEALRAGAQYLTAHIERLDRIDQH